MTLLAVVFPLLEMYALYVLNTVTANTILSFSTNESCICHNVENGVLADCLNLTEMPGFGNKVKSANVSRNVIQHLHGKHLHDLKNLYISSDSHYKNLPNGYCPYMLNGIENGTIRNPKELQLLDICERLPTPTVFSYDLSENYDIIYNKSSKEQVKFSIPYIPKNFTAGVYYCSAINTINQGNENDTIRIVVAYKNLEKDCPTYIWIIVVSVCCIIAVAAMICAVLVYRFRWKLRYWYYVVKRAYGYHRLTTHDDYQFDAFISYADNDRYFPRDEMVKHLEKQRGFRLCIHDRDFIAGCSIAENVTNAIHNSRKIVCLLTEDFMRSDWCKYEFNIANVESTVSRQGQNMIILLMLKGTHFTNIPFDIMLMISEETYIQYPDEAEYKAVFWDRLADSLK